VKKVVFEESFVKSAFHFESSPFSDVEYFFYLPKVRSGIGTIIAHANGIKSITLHEKSSVHRKIIVKKLQVSLSCDFTASHIL